MNAQQENTPSELVAGLVTDGKGHARAGLAPVPHSSRMKTDPGVYRTRMDKEDTP